MAVTMSAVPFVLGLVCVFVYYVYRRWKTFQNIWRHLKNIPGPKGISVFGNLFELLGDTEHGFQKVREYSLKFPTMFRIRIAYARLVVFIYNPEDVEAVTNNMKHLTKSDLYDLLHDWLGTGLLTSTGSKWQERRKILTPAFHFSILNEFLNIFNRETEHLVQEIKAQSSQIVDVVNPITAYTLSSIGETSLGVQISKYPNSNNYKEAIYDFGECLFHKLNRPWLNVPLVKYLFPTFRKDKETVAVLHQFSKSIIENRRKEVEADLKGSYSMRKKLALLDLLLRARYQEGINIDDEDIREEIDTFMFEGHDTTAVSLCFTLLALANEPKIQEELYQEIIDILGDKKVPDANDIANMLFLERCVKESLRLYPSVPGIGRKAGEDIKTKEGYIIPKGCEINIFIYAMHRNPVLWENPEKFDPDRFLPENITTRHPFSYIPFSAGPRNCIGQRYALYELKAAICGILRNFKLEAVDNPADMKIKRDLVLRTNSSMRVKFVPRE